MTTRRLSRVQLAYQKCKRGRDALFALENARLMESTEDRCGMLWERWILMFQNPNRIINLILCATPHSWDIYWPINLDPGVEDTLKTLKTIATQ